MIGVLLMNTSIIDAQDTDQDGSTNGVLLMDFMCLDGGTPGTPNRFTFLGFEASNGSGTTEGWGIQTTTGSFRVDEQSCFETSGDLGILEIFEGAPSASLTLTANGNGMGTTAPTELLHLRSTGVDYPRAQILIENAHGASVVRELMRLKNNGGSSIALENTNTGNTTLIGVDAVDILHVGGGGNGKIQIAPGAPDKSVFAGILGVGIGHDTPEEALHIRADGNAFESAKILVEDVNPLRAARNMLELKNNGGVRVRLNNTDINESWLLTTDQTNKLQFRILGPAKPFFGQRANGFFEVGTNGQLNFNVRPNGNAFLRGTMQVQNLVQTSDRHAKEKFKSVDVDEILEKVAAMPVTSWQYKGEDGNVRHVGPVAQDFYSAFGLGENEKTISAIDADGISLAAIKGLYEQVKKKDKKISELAARIERSELEKEDLLDRLERLEAAVESLTSQN